MVYAQVADLKARAGRLAGSWSRDTSPGDADLERFLGDESAKLDIAIQARGLDPPAEGTTAAASLRGIVADGALLLALTGTFPAGEGPAAAQELIRTVQERYNAVWESINAGTFWVIQFLEGTDTDATNASNFWDEEPEYGLPGSVDPDSLNPYLQPEAERGMVF